MFARTVVGAALAAAVVFMWGFVYWTLLPYSSRVIQGIEAEALVAEHLKSHLPNSGVYLLPMERSTEADAVEASKQRSLAGPFAMIFFRHEGVDPMSARSMGFGYLQMFLAALAAGIALSASDVSFYPGRVMIVFWIGVFSVLWMTLSDVAWFHFPMDYFWLKLGYTLPAALIMGIVLAAFIRPTKQPAT